MTVVGAEVDGPVDPLVWVTLTQAAERRGVSKQAISKQVARLEADGSLETRPGKGGAKLINIVEYERAIAAETDPAQALRNGTAPTAMPDEPDDGSPVYSTSRAQREAYQAEGARLDLEERLGNLAYADEVERRVVEAYRRTRDRLLGLPAQVAPSLAEAGDERAIRMLLTAELRKVLEALADELDHVAERDEDDGEFGDAEGDERPDDPEE